ncbi:uncharacterized protein LOC129293547 [Prosopis cineraria]|uniref:uncharacterized protein LOC129293547 n=1 Tax=Prosopis cineraria TaxID=364024 RepID=UPI00240FBB1B|nr:uncharacterized protein LOC129293547 [Prosopis cineraria]
MDLGCLDLGCLSPSENQRSDPEAASNSRIKEDSGDSISANSKIGKNKLSREASQSISSALNKFSSQIKKPPHRKTSPVNWFPRKKVDSYLKRKIEMLQEVAGMNLTLDQTLGSSNPHYSKVLKEKMAAKEAVHKAMEARRAALVEASWCRILRAARIPSEDAEAKLSKAEENALEAFEAAQALGVIMYDMINCPRKRCQIETSTVTSEGSSTHTVTASFETEFEVDKEVAAAVKTAFIRLANCPSFKKDEFGELLRKISQNPDTDDSSQDLHDFSSEFESESGSEHDLASQNSDFSCQELDSNMPILGISQRKSRRRQSLEKINRIKLVDMLIERLKCLQEDELSSLATIVATCGLNSVLAEAQNIKLGSATDHSSSSRINFPARRMSTLGSRKPYFVMDGQMRNKQAESKLPSLDKFLVKRMTKLEREVQEAKNSRSNETETETETDRDGPRKSVDGTPSETIPDLGSILVKNYSKFEKDMNEAKNKSGKEISRVPLGLPMPNRRKDHAEVPSLDKFLVKHVSRLEREVQEAKCMKVTETKSLKKKADMTTIGGINSHSCSDGSLEEKENLDLNNRSSTETEQNGCKLNADTSSFVGVNDGIEDNKDSLDKILVKPGHRLEREKIQAMSQGSHDENYRQRKNQGVTNATDCESLDKILVKHVSRLEKEKMRLKSEEDRFEVKRNQRNTHLETNEEGGLDQILIKHKSRLEREKMKVKPEEERLVTRSQRSNRLLQTNEEGSLDQILVKHKPRLEREKMVASPQQENTISHSMIRREERERELQEAWGGLSLGNSMKPSLSKLEREKAAWIKAEEEAMRKEMKAI